MSLAISCKYIPNTNREPQKIAEHIKQEVDEYSAVLICPPFYDLTFLYHFDQDLFKTYTDREKKMNKKNIWGIYNVVDAKLEGVEQIFYVDANAKFLYPDNVVLQDLENAYQHQESITFAGDYSVHRFIKN